MVVHAGDEGEPAGMCVWSWLVDVQVSLVNPGLNEASFVVCSCVCLNERTVRLLFLVGETRYSVLFVSRA